VIFQIRCVHPLITQGAISEWSHGDGKHIDEHLVHTSRSRQGMHGKQRRPLILQRHRSYQISCADYTFHAGADYENQTMHSSGADYEKIRFVTIEFPGQTATLPNSICPSPPCGPLWSCCGLSTDVHLIPYSARR
jgi:hypothetical protein